MQRRPAFSVGRLFLYELYSESSHIFAIRLPFPVADHPLFGAIHISTPIFSFFFSPLQAMRFSHGRIGYLGMESLGQNGQILGVGCCAAASGVSSRKSASGVGSLDPASPRREASLFNSPANQWVSRQFFVRIRCGVPQGSQTGEAGTAPGGSFKHQQVSDPYRGLCCS